MERQREGPVSWVDRCDEQVISVHKPFRVRFGANLAVAAYAASWVWPNAGISASIHRHWLLIIGVVWCAWLSGPQDLSLDLQRHIYRYRGGWLHQLRAVTGPFSDIATVGIQHETNGVQPYQLLLIWQVPDRRPTFLGRCLSAGEAEAQRAFLIEKLGLAA